MEHEGLVTLSGRRVLVSGGTHGIGRAICAHLLDLGARVFTFARHPDHVEAGRAGLPEATVGVGDQGDLDDLTRLVGEAEAALGGIDAVIVNAGIGGASVTNMATAAWTDVMSVNLLGPMHLAALAAPRVEAAGGGHVVFLGSMSAKTRSEGGDVYVASKLGLRGFADSYGRGVAARNVNVCLVEPGLVRSEMTAEAHPDWERDVAEARMILPDDVARAVAFVLTQPPRVCLPLVQVRPRGQLI